MVVLVWVADVERDLHLREERDRESELAVVRADIEREAVGAGCQRTFGQRIDAPLAVGGAAADRRPLARLAELEDDGQPFGRRAARDVEHMCRDHRFMSWSSFRSLASRSCVIFFCSFAAIRSSSPGSLFS